MRVAIVLESTGPVQTEACWDAAQREMQTVELKEVSPLYIILNDTVTFCTFTCK